MSEVSPDDTAAYRVFREIQESRGMKFLNQQHARSFSLNIFQMNAVALVEAALHIKDPDNGMALMSDGNRDAGRQAHRELSRHLHNFVASAMTLVEHTRSFMRREYEGTDVFKQYSDQSISAFATDPVSQFVQGLRNYMVHRGLPNSHMFFEMKPDENGDLQAISGVRIDTASLLEWDGWKAPAKNYIQGSGKTLDIHAFVEEYLARVNRFYAGLDSALRQFHAEDLAELARLQQLEAETDAARAEQGLDALALTVGGRPEASLMSEEDAVASRISELSDDLTRDVFSKIREISHRTVKSDFPSQRHVTVELTEKDIIGNPAYWGPDKDGTPALTYIFHENKTFGLAEEDHAILEKLTDQIQSDRWVSTRVSRNFVLEEFLAWSGREFIAPTGEAFSKALVSAAISAIKPIAVWLPIAHLEIEEPLPFGPVTISPITKDMLDGLEGQALAKNAEQETPLRSLFEDIRKQYQGSAAVVFEAEAEPIFAEERALLVGRDAVHLLRFFSPGGAHLEILCPAALDGAEIIPQTKVMIIKGDSLSSTSQRIAVKDFDRWRIRSRDLVKLQAKGLAAAGSLVIPNRLNEFQHALRTSLITYSKGTTFLDPFDRLGHAVTALEGSLLKHSMEPIEFNVAERMSFLLSKDDVERAEIARNVRQVYRLRTRDRTTPLSEREQNALSTFIYGAYAALSNVLANADRFVTKAEFVAAVDKAGAREGP